MARTTAQIKQTMVDAIAADPDLSTTLLSQSKRAIWNLFLFVVATGVSYLEQILDMFLINVEAVAASAAPASALWLQKQVLLFQYSASTPQIIQLINFAPVYPLVDPSLQIISRCSVTTALSGKVVVKVATGNPPAPLDGPQIAALTSYLNPPNGLGVAGVNYSIVSLAADQLFVEAQIFYQGQYSSVIQVNVIAAINNYLAALPFDGRMKISDLEGAIKAVPGVNDVILTDVRARPDTTTIGDAIPLVQGADVLARQWVTVSGYIISEQTESFTLSDSLTFTAE